MYSVILAVSWNHICINIYWIFILEQGPSWLFSLHLPKFRGTKKKTHISYVQNMEISWTGCVFLRWSTNSPPRQTSQILRFLFLDFPRHSLGDFNPHCLENKRQPEWRRAEWSWLRNIKPFQDKYPTPPKPRPQPGFMDRFDVENRMACVGCVCVCVCVGAYREILRLAARKNRVCKKLEHRWKSLDTFLYPPSKSQTAHCRMFFFFMHSYWTERCSQGSCWWLFTSESLT